MKHVKIFIHPDKTIIKMIVRYKHNGSDYYSVYNGYFIETIILLPNKKKWREPTSEERAKYITSEDILQATLECWEKLKPE